MYTVLENLINRKYYATKDEIVKKLNLFMAYKVLTDDEYTKLMDLVATQYPDTPATGA